MLVRTMCVIALFTSACTPLPTTTNDGGDASLDDATDDLASVDVVSDVGTDVADADGGTTIPTSPWAHAVIQAGNIFSVAIDPATKRVVAAGYGFDPIETVVVASYQADGTPAWQKIMPKGISTNVTLDAQGNAYVIGSSNGVDLGGGAIVTGAFCVKYDAAGNYVWAYHTTGNSSFSNVRLLSNGNVVIVGVLIGSDDYGGGTVSSTGPAGAIAVELDASGKYSRAQQWGTTNAHSGFSGLAIDAQDHVLIGGYYETSIDFGGGAMTASADNFLVELDASFAFVRQMPMKNKYIGWGDFAFDSSGNVLISITNGQGDVTLGGVTITSTAQYGQIIFAKLDSTLTAVWHKEHSGTLGVIPKGVSVMQGNQLVVTGYYAGIIDLGKGDLPNGTAETLFVVQLDSSGNAIASLGLGAPNVSTEGYGAVWMVDSDFILAGNCAGSTTLPMLPPITCSSERDAIVARIPLF